MNLGFIGLGTMGRGMARNLAGTGNPLWVFDLDTTAMAELAAAGATPTSGVAELAHRVDVVFTSLPGPRQLDQVIFGDDGLAHNLRPGMVLFDLSTSSLSMTRRIEAEFAKVGATMLDAPVSGGPAGAAAGQLALWVGGDKPTFDQHLELLQAIGDKPRHVGPIGAGTVTKLAHNMVGYMIMLSLAEIFSLAVKADMDPLELWKAMRLGLVGKRSPLDLLTAQFLPATYEPPAFALSLAHKDVSLATEMARELGVPMRLADLTFDEMTEAVGRGFGHLDSRSFLQLQLERAGVQIQVDPALLAKAIEDAAADRL